MSPELLSKEQKLEYGLPSFSIVRPEYRQIMHSGIYCSNIQTSCWGDRDQIVICIRPGKIPVFDLGA